MQRSMNEIYEEDWLRERRLPVVRSSWSQSCASGLLMSCRYLLPMHERVGWGQLDCPSPKCRRIIPPLRFPLLAITFAFPQALAPSTYRARWSNLVHHWEKRL